MTASLSQHKRRRSPPEYVYTPIECARISLAEGEAMNSLKPLIGTLRVKKSRPAKGGHQPEASLARSRATVDVKRRQRVCGPCDTAPKV